MIEDLSLGHMSFVSLPEAQGSALDLCMLFPESRQNGSGFDLSSQGGGQ